MRIRPLKIMCCLLTIFFCSCYAYASVEIKNFPPESKRARPLEYAWASCSSYQKECKVIIWIRGVHQDTRIIIKGKVEKNLCNVKIPAKTFDKYFKYAVLAGFATFGKGPIIAMFGGGPAGGRDFYYFEWSKNVEPSFYCVLR